MINKIGLRDTHIALIFVYASIGIPFVIWMMMGFFDGIPRELDEAALMIQKKIVKGMTMGAVKG